MTKEPYIHDKRAPIFMTKEPYFHGQEVLYMSKDTLKSSARCSIFTLEIHLQRVLRFAAGRHSPTSALQLFSLLFFLPTIFSTLVNI